VFAARYGLIPYIEKITFGLYTVKKAKAGHFEVSEQIYPTQCSHPKIVVGIAPIVKEFLQKVSCGILLFVAFKAVSFKNSGLLGYEVAPSVSKDSSTFETDYSPKQRHMPAVRHYKIRFYW
jgi:hypothetical protein